MSQSAPNEASIQNEVSEVADRTLQVSTDAVEQTAQYSVALLEQLLNTFPMLSNWWFKIFLILCVGLLINYSKKSLMSWLLKRTQKSQNYWDDALLNALQASAGLFILVLTLEAMRQVLILEFQSMWLNQLGLLPGVGLIASVALFFGRFIREAELALIRTKSRKGQQFDRTTANAVGKLLRLIVYVVAILVTLKSFGVSISGILAFGGVGGMVIGFAAKDLLANFFGALMIYLDRPFKVGDWVRSPDREIEGTVEEIGWRVTRIITFDQRPLYIPNAVFTTIAIENPSRMANRRINEVIGIRYDDVNKVDEITDKIRNMLMTHAEIEGNNTIIVNLNGFSASSVDILVYCFTSTTDWIHFHVVKQAILLEIKDIISQSGACIAFPTSTLHIESRPSMETSPFTETD